jgi:hypothetical protein
MDRVTQRLWRGVEEPVPRVAEGPRRSLFTHAARSFSTTEARTGQTRHRLSLFHGSQIFVEPVERFLNHLRSRYVVSRTVNHAALVLLGGS